MNIGMMGMGIIGKTTAQVMEKKHKIYPYDKYKGPYNSQEHLTELVKNSEVIFVSVPTPMKISGEIDYNYIYDALNLLNHSFEENKKDKKKVLIVIRSTAVSGTTDKFAREYDFKFAFNPEFLTERRALEDMNHTKHVVIGVEDEESQKKLLDVYKPLFPDARYIIVDRKTAEMIKYATNAMLASQVSVANELYQICSSLGIDYNVVKEAMLFHENMATNINVPGPDGDLGFGGKCLPKDINALIYLSREKGYRPHLLESVWALNEKVRTKKDWLDIPGAVSGNSFNNKSND